MSDPSDEPVNKKPREAQQHDDPEPIPATIKTVPSILSPLKKYKSKKKHQPLFYLTRDSMSNLRYSQEQCHLGFSDMRKLLLHSLFGRSYLKPDYDWYQLENTDYITQVTCLVIEGVSAEHWTRYSDVFVNAKIIFNYIVQVVSPSVCDGSFAQEIALLVLTYAEREIQRYGNINILYEPNSFNSIMRALFPMWAENINTTKLPDCDRFPRTQLLLSTWQLLQHKYPVPLKTLMTNEYNTYALTQDKYKPVGNHSPLFGLACERSLTSDFRAVFREIAIVDDKHDVVYQALVRNSCNPSGTPLENVQMDIKRLLPPDAILVGHSISKSMHLLRIIHPYIIDINRIYNCDRDFKPSLNELAGVHLNMPENACRGIANKALLSLRLTQYKLGKYLVYGDTDFAKKERFKNRYKKFEVAHDTCINSSKPNTSKTQKTSLIVGCQEVIKFYKEHIISVPQENETQESGQITASESNRSVLNESKTIEIKTADDSEQAVSALIEGIKHTKFVTAHLKYDLKADGEEETMKNIDGWIKKVYENMPNSSFFYVMLGGRSSAAGLAMMKMKVNYE